MVISCCVNLCWNPRLPRKNRGQNEFRLLPSNEDQTGGTHRQRRTNSGLYRKLQTARASTFHQSEFDDDDSWSWDDTLMMNQFDLANSTPMATRKIIT